MRKLILILALTMTAGASAGEIVIPAIYRGPGAFDTLWRTEIALTNVSASIVPPITATITLHREGKEPIAISTPLTPMETLVIPDAVFDWFNLQQGGGLVRITWPQSEGRLSARARIYNVDENGEYGQSVPGRPIESLQSDNILSGLSGLNGNRTNVGISNPHETGVLVWIELYDTAGETRGGFTHWVPARSYHQLDDIFGYFQAGPLQAATVRVSSTSLSVYAYASIVRNDTGDATFVISQ